MKTDISTINDSGLLRVVRRRRDIELTALNSNFRAALTPTHLQILSEPRVVRGVRGVSVVSVANKGTQVLVLQRFREYGAWGDIVRLLWTIDYLMVIYTHDLARAVNMAL